MRGLFAALIPKGNTDIAEHAGMHTHHTALEQSIPGVKRAMATEVRTSDGKLQRYVYVEPEAGAEVFELPLSAFSGAPSVPAWRQRWV